MADLDAQLAAIGAWADGDPEFQPTAHRFIDSSSRLRGWSLFLLVEEPKYMAESATKSRSWHNLGGKSRPFSDRLIEICHRPIGGKQ